WPASVATKDAHGLVAVVVQPNPGGLLLPVLAEPTEQGVDRVQLGMAEEASPQLEVGCQGQRGVDVPPGPFPQRPTPERGLLLDVPGVGPVVAGQVPPSEERIPVIRGYGSTLHGAASLVECHRVCGGHPLNLW